jgi:L-lactate dehydrogenase (cytochrome)
MANLVDHFREGAFVDQVIERVNDQFDPSVTWKDVENLRKSWGGPFILKGIQSVDDALLAVELGATGIVLSNHGGRQLDGSPAPLDLLPEVVKVVGDKTEILIDGGITRGADVIKALALGAKACLIGRAALYGLGAGGKLGVTRCYEILQEEMIRTMRLIGCNSISDLNPSYVKKRK